MDDCIFCKIIKKDIPCDIVYEDKDFLAFLDINPVTDGHLLVIPKVHAVWMQEADDEIISGIFKLAKKLMLAQKQALSSDYIGVSVAGKDVPHFHVHLIPRMLNDGLQGWPTKKYQAGEETELIKKITQKLS